MKRYNLEFTIEIDYVPYTVLAEGNDLEELLADAQYNEQDNDNGNDYRDIGNLPAKKYDEVLQTIASEMQACDESTLESRQDR